MIYPIVIIGDPILREETKEINKDYPNLPKLIDDMFETMYEASGVGLAAPQIGLPIRLFVVDASPMEEEGLEGFKKVFINPEILTEEGEGWKFEEGCLSIPGLREMVERQADIRISYYDENFNHHEETYSGLAARVIQHEYDHLEGILFTDKLSPLRKSLIKNKLAAISKGMVKADYKYKVYRKKK